jgi:hypothetical protein
VVERATLVRTIAWSPYRSRTRRAIGAVAGVGKRADDRGRGASDSAECESGCAIRISAVDDHYRVTLGARCEPPPDRTPAETGGNVECPRFPPPDVFRSKGSCRPENYWACTRPTTAFTCGPAARNVMSRKTVMPARQVQRFVSPRRHPCVTALPPRLLSIVILAEHLIVRRFRLSGLAPRAGLWHAHTTGYLWPDCG